MQAAEASLDCDAERLRLVERARLAVALDRDLRLACRAEAAARRAVGLVARQLLRQRAYQRLGFVQLRDYARERLGISGRALESAACIATQLEALPLLSAAFDRGELSWTRVRVLCGVVRREDEAEWLEHARACTIEELEVKIAAYRAATGNAVAPDLGDDDGRIDGEPAVRLRIVCPARLRCLWRYALELARRVAGEQLATWSAAEIIAAEGIAGRPQGTPVGDRALLALMRVERRLCGRDTRDNERRTKVVSPNGDTAASPTLLNTGAVGTAELPARHASSGMPPETTVDAPPATVESLAPSPREPAGKRDDDLAGCDAFTLDARLSAAIGGIRRAEPRIGRLLRMIVDHQLYRTLGFPSVDRYVRECLGISLSKAWALIKVEKTARRAGAFADAYERGSMSWTRALTLLPVVDRSNAVEWLARASAVTVRRLADEVTWALDVRDALGPDVPLRPPPLDTVLAPPALALRGAAPSGRAKCGQPASMSRALCESEDPMRPGQCRKTSPAATVRIGTSPPVIVQIGASSPQQDAWSQNGSGAISTPEVSDAEVQFSGPASVVALFRDALDVFARAGEPHWAALERLLKHVVADWEAEPRHRDPVFARDGWRCGVPACSSRRNLQDHHIRFRSHGGGNELENRIGLCAGHHLHGIHTGVIQASGTSPGAVYWRLGVRTGGPPFLEYVGDRLVRGTADSSPPGS